MFNEYPCRSVLTDEEFLQHMIPHHQMAINISRQHDKYTRNDIIKTLIRDLIRTQSYEIYLMITQLKNKMINVSLIQEHNSLPNTTISSSYPNTIQLTNTYCDPHFFNPNVHNLYQMKNNNHNHNHNYNHHHQQKILNITTDKMYIEHMIPHHQVAIDMCKLIMKNTKSDFIMSLAYDMLKTQEAEVFLLYNLFNTQKLFNELNNC